MRKLASFLLVIVVAFIQVATAGCHPLDTDNRHVHKWNKTKTVAPTCTEQGYDLYTCAICGETREENYTEPLGHLGDFSEDADEYFRMKHCVREGCYSYVRQESLHTYDDVFKYTFNEGRQTAIDEMYQAILANLNAAEPYDATKHANTPVNGVYDHTSSYYIANKQNFEEALYNPYLDELEYVTEQYQYAYVFYCVYQGDEQWEADFDAISQYRTEMVNNYYKLFKLIYDTQYREFFFSPEEGWTEDDIQEALLLSDSYGSDEYAQLNNRAEEIAMEFRNISTPETSATVPSLFAELVEVNNSIAQLAGYENYMEYAYENVYGRDYTVQDVEQMREFCKMYLKPAYQALYSDYELAAGTTISGTAVSYYNALLANSIFTSQLSTEIVADYFEVLNSNTAGNSPIDFYNEVNLLFKNGNYYTGEYQGAFSYYIPTQDTTILYFGPDSYSGAFTFVHEFGHYFNNIYNHGISISMDHDETQSQGDEMLMLAWLKDYLSQKVGSDNVVYEVVYLEQMFNMMAIAMLATAVDEFEEAVYTGSWGDYTQIAPSQYDALFKDIMKQYGIEKTLNSAYWRYVVIEAPCYYISYSMSALPSMGIYVKAMQEGFDVAKESYFKLFTFSDNQAFTTVDGAGDKVVTATYQEILNYCGLYGPFQQELYQQLSNFFLNS